MKVKIFFLSLTLGFTLNPKSQNFINEKYMKSDKYPYATFQGKINDVIDYKKDGTYKVTAAGKLNIHGIEKERITDGTITIKDKEIILNAKFMVALNEFFFYTILFYYLLFPHCCVF